MRNDHLSGPQSIRAVFFDVGGTLAHARPSFNGLLAQLCQEAGLAVSEAAATQAEPRVWARMREQIGGGRGFSLSPERSRQFWLWVYQVFLEELGFPDRPDLPPRLLSVFSRPESYQLFDDALPTLARLQEAGRLLGVISNWEPWADRLLDGLGIRGYFHCTVISGHLGVEKPDPRIFLHALEAVGVPAAQAVHVGDNPQDDVLGAQRVGIRAVLLDRNHTLGAAGSRAAPLIPPEPERPDDQPGACIRSLLELPRLLGIQ